jgi:hypothetical protein
VRIFRTPSPGVLRLDDSVAVTEAHYDGSCCGITRSLIAGSVNVTTSLCGHLTETGDPGRRFAVNCDIAPTVRPPAACAPPATAAIRPP